MAQTLNARETAAIILQAMKDRRSIRNYTGEAIPKEDLDLIVEAGLTSASGHADYPWDIVVVQDLDVVHKLTGARAGSANMLKNATARSSSPTCTFWRTPWATEAAGSRSACVLTPRAETQKILCAVSSRCRKASAWRPSFPSVFRKKKRPRTMLPARQNGPASPRKRCSISNSDGFSTDITETPVPHCRNRRFRYVKAVFRSFFRIRARLIPAANQRIRAAKASATARMSSGRRFRASFTISSGIP